MEDMLDWALEETESSSREAAMTAERVLRAHLLSSTARESVEKHKEPTTPPKMRRDCMRPGGRVGMDEGGTNQPKLFTIFKKLSLPGTKLLEHTSLTSPSPGASTTVLSPPTASARGDTALFS